MILNSLGAFRIDIGMASVQAMIFRIRGDLMTRPWNGSGTSSCVCVNGAISATAPAPVRMIERDSQRQGAAQRMPDQQRLLQTQRAYELRQRIGLRPKPRRCIV